MGIPTKPFMRNNRLANSLLSVSLMLALLFSTSDLIAQRNGKKAESQNVIGINITSTLAGFFNSGGQNIPKDPFLFSFKVDKGDHALRFGIDFSIDHSESFIGNTLRNVQEDDFKFRAGYEWQKPVSERFTMHYGIDGVVTYYYQKTSVEFFPSDLSSFEKTRGIGGGPFLGVTFHLSERVSLSTETYAYLMFEWGNSSTDIDPNLPPEKEDINRVALLPAVPNSLYIHFSF